MSTSQASGSQTATVTTEHTLATVTAAGTFILTVDLSNMALGDKLTLRSKIKVRSTGATRLVDVGHYAHVQERLVAVSIPLPTVTESVFTLEQTTGTGRVFEWEVTKD